MSSWSWKDITRLEQRGYKVINTLPTKPEAKLSKYGNKKKEVDGILFDSMKEAKRFGELRLLLKAGKIGMLRLQVPYQLNSGGTHSLIYLADFVYIDAVTGLETVEDVKGFRTAVYKKKKRLMKKVWGIEIKEI